jgi:3-oxoacyl-[acyl-carrier protein] reductase
MTNNNQKVILITGTRKGIGKHLAEYYSIKGFHVIGCSRESADYSLPNYKHYSCDITKENQVKKMLRDIKKTRGHIDILINNAGVNLTLQSTLLVSYRNALKTVEINLLGTFLMCREVTKLMMKNSFGRIINFSSMAVKHELKGEAIYTASKAAIISFTRVLAKELYPIGITCNVISPSAIETDLMNGIGKNALKDVLSRNAVKTMGKMEDVSNAVDWLIKPESDAITGQVIYLGGV